MGLRRGCLLLLAIAACAHSTEREQTERPDAPDTTTRACGNGLVEGLEPCDDGNIVNTDACKNDCTPNICGDGVINTGIEQCDDGNQVDTDACRNTCATAVCGDGLVTGGEECDDSNLIDTDACRNSCVAARCGDGVIATGETCDDGNNTNGDGCAANCTQEEFCGDGILQGGEFCDNGPGSMCFDFCWCVGCGGGGGA